MPNIRPLTELNDPEEIIRLCHETDEPVFLTKNGYEDIVIMSNETYEKEFAYLIIEEKLRTAQEQIKNGQCGKWEDLKKELLNMIGDTDNEI